MPRAPAAALPITDQDRCELPRIAGLRWAPQNVVLRAKIVLGAARGVGNKNATHWSVRLMAREAGLSPATFQRIWKRHHLQPHPVELFKFSSDPEFVSKVRDIVEILLLRAKLGTEHSIDASAFTRK